MFGFMKKKTASPNTPVNNDSPISTTKSTQASPQKVTLEKATESLDRYVVSLQKNKSIDLSKHKARVVLVVDRSGSMSSLYRNGSVQDTMTRILPIAKRFDDNGELEVFVFDTEYTQLKPMTSKNFENYVKQEIMDKGYGPGGCTSYAPVIKRIIKLCQKDSLPTFVIFITDGENDDRTATDVVIRDSSNYKIFFQFVGIGDEKFSYLQKLDDLSGRKADNTAFTRVTDFKKLTDDELYEKLLEQYPQWLRAMGIQQNQEIS